MLEDHREKVKVLWTCQEKGKRACAKKNVRCSSNRKETKREAENQVEKLVEKRRGKCGVNGGGRIGQDKVEDRYSKPFQRPQVMGKALEEENDTNCKARF